MSDFRVLNLMATCTKSNQVTHLIRFFQVAFKFSKRDFVMNIELADKLFFATLLTCIVIAFSYSVRYIFPSPPVSISYGSSVFSIFPVPVIFSSISFRKVTTRAFSGTVLLKSPIQIRLSNKKLLSAFGARCFNSANPQRISTTFACCFKSFVHACLRAVSCFSFLRKETLNGVRIPAVLTNFFYMTSRLYLVKFFALIRAIILFLQSTWKFIDIFPTVNTLDCNHINSKEKAPSQHGQACYKEANSIVSVNCLLAQVIQLT